MKGTFTTILFGVALAVLASGQTAVAEPLARVDAKLEQWMRDRAAAKVGPLRGALESEWRPETKVENLLEMSGREASLLLHGLDGGASTSTALVQEQGPPKPVHAVDRPIRMSPNRATRVVQIDAVPVYASFGVEATVIPTRLASTTIIRQ